MKIVKGYPPNYEAICAVFPVRDQPGLVFAYGDTLYWPDYDPTGVVPENLLVHEWTHERQQAGDPEGWWEKYLADPAFRMDQELEAYAAQYTCIRKHYSYGRSQEFLERISHDLCNMYAIPDLEQSVIESKIRNRAKALGYPQAS